MVLIALAKPKWVIQQNKAHPGSVGVPIVLKWVIQQNKD